MTTTVDDPEQGVPLPDEPEDISSSLPVPLRDLKSDLTRFLMVYKFGIDEMMTKINILRDEFTYARDYNPIEHVKSRLKSPESIIAKLAGRGRRRRSRVFANMSATSPVSASRAASRPTSTASWT